MVVGSGWPMQLSNLLPAGAPGGCFFGRNSNQIGRAACRGRGEISVGGGLFKKKKIKEEAEMTNINISSLNEYNLNVLFLTANARVPKHKQLKLNIGILAKISENVVQRRVPHV